MNENVLTYKRMSTRTRFEDKAKGNSEMGYLNVDLVFDVLLGTLIPAVWYCSHFVFKRAISSVSLNVIRASDANVRTNYADVCVPHSAEGILGFFINFLTRHLHLRIFVFQVRTFFTSSLPHLQLRA